MIFIDGISGSEIVSACLRDDLAPIPLTLEAEVRITSANIKLLQDGVRISVNNMPFRIIKPGFGRNMGGVTQGGQALSTVSIIAFHDGIADVADRRRSAVIGKNLGLAAIYRACGAKVSISGDVLVPTFTCFAGDVPTFHLARILQEEAVIARWKKGAIVIERLQAALDRDAVTSIPEGGSEAMKSAMLDRDAVPRYFSTAPDGSIVAGPARGAAPAWAYSPRKDARQLGMMGRALIHRQVAQTTPDMRIGAGDMVQIGSEKLIVMTAAHYLQTSADGSGSNQYSRFWLGALS